MGVGLWCGERVVRSIEGGGLPSKEIGLARWYGILNTG